MKNKAAAFFLSFIFKATLAQVAPSFSYSDLPLSALQVPKTFIVQELNGMGAIPVPVSGIDQVWNFGNYTPASPQPLTFYTVRTDFFPGATMYEEGLADYIKGNFIPYDVYHRLNQDGLAVLGRHYFPFALDLESVSGIPGDSLYIPEQHVPALVQPSYRYRYPQEFGDQYIFDVSYSVAGTVTFSPAGYNHAPFVKKTSESHEVTVSGWGTALVPAPGGVSEPLPVLLQRTKITVRDSFFVNGQPAPAPLLAFFGLPSGVPVEYSRSDLYRGKSYMPLLTFQHSDGSFGPVDKLWLIYDELGTAGAELLAEESTEVFPNPCSDRLFLPNVHLGTDVVLTDFSGRVVYSQTAKQIGLYEFVFPSSLKNGFYFLQTSEGVRAKIQIQR